MLASLHARRDLLLDLHAHGDIRLTYDVKFRNDQALHWDGGVRFFVTDLVVIERWTTLDADEAADGDLWGRFSMSSPVLATSGPASQSDPESK